MVVGLSLVWWGRAHHIPWLRNADAIAALFVAGVVVYVSGRFGPAKTIDALFDAAPSGIRNKIF